MDDYTQERRARKDHPDSEVRVIKGEDWSRTHRMACPVCGRAFWTWECLARPCAPGDSDPEPEVVNGVSQGSRRTCGATYCEQAEDHHQLHRGDAYARTCAAYTLSIQK